MLHRSVNWRMFVTSVLHQIIATLPVCWGDSQNRSHQRRARSSSWRGRESARMDPWLTAAKHTRLRQQRTMRIDSEQYSVVLNTRHLHVQYNQTSRSKTNLLCTFCCLLVNTVNARNPISVIFNLLRHLKMVVCLFHRKLHIKVQIN